MRIKTMIILLFYLLGITLMANSLLLTVNSDFATSLDISTTGFGINYLVSIFKLFVNIMAFQVSDIPVVINLIFFDMPLLVIIVIVIDLVF